MSYSHTAHHPTELKQEEKTFQLSPALRKKILISVILFHFFVIVLPYLTSLLARWLKPVRPRGIVVKLVEGIPGQIGNPAPANPNPTPTPPTPTPPTPTPPTPVPPVIRPQPTINPIRIKPQPKIDMSKIRRITVKPTPPTPQPDIRPLTPQEKSQINENTQNGIYHGKDPDKRGTVENPGNGGGAVDPSGYYDAVGSYIYSRWREPSKTEMRDRSPVVTVSVTLDSEGRILEARIVRASGVRQMDNSVMELLKSLTSLPKPPSDIRSFTINLVVRDE